MPGGPPPRWSDSRAAGSIGTRAWRAISRIDSLVNEPVDAGGADQDGRSDGARSRSSSACPVPESRSPATLGWRQRNGCLVGVEVVATFDDEAVRVEEDHALATPRPRSAPSRVHRRAEQPGDADAGRARADDHDALRRASGVPRSAQPASNPAEHDGRRALDVVVEATGIRCR